MEEVKQHPCSEALKRLWADPEWRANCIANMTKGVRKVGGRHGVPDGMTRAVAKRFWKQARFEATLTMKKLAKAGVLDDADEQAQEALHYALTTMRAPGDVRNGLAAARLVLEYTKAKPASKSEVTVNKAEEWLAAVTEVNGKANESDAGDAEASA